jgi:hypothetical protein
MQQTIITERRVEEAPARTAAVNALAVVGFLALVFLGIMLAIYAARYIPEVISGLGSDSDSDTAAGIEAVPATIPFNETPATPAPVATTSPTPAVTPAPAPVYQHPAATAPKPAPIVGYQTITTPYPTPGSVRIPTNPTLFGLPNLVTTIVAVGYVDSHGTFFADNSIDTSDRLAVKFRVTNTGTNKAEDWKVRVTLPTESDRSFDFNSRTQDDLLPNGYVDFVAHLDPGDARDEDNQDITVEADYENDVRETNESDNDARAEIDVR